MNKLFDCMSNIFFSTKNSLLSSIPSVRYVLFILVVSSLRNLQFILYISLFLINGSSLVYLILLYTAVFVSLLFLRYATCSTNESNPVLFLAFSILTSSLFSFFYTPLLMNSEEIAYIHSPVKASRHSIYTHTHTPL